MWPITQGSWNFWGWADPCQENLQWKASHHGKVAGILLKPEHLGAKDLLTAWAGWSLPESQPWSSSCGKSSRENWGVVFERGLKVPLQYKESIVISDDFCFLCPYLPQGIQATPTDICDQELRDAILAPYMEQTINANGNRCRIIQVTFRLLLSKLK